MAKQKNNQNLQNDQNDSQRKSRRKHRLARTITLVVVHALAVGAIVGLSVALYYSEDKNEMQLNYRRDMESIYSRNYYDLLDGANELDVNLAKLNAAGTSERQQAILYDVWSAAELAGNNLSAFESENDSVRKATKFLGQLGDYSHYLAKRLGDGEPLGAEERATLVKLRKMTGVLKDALKTVQSSIDEGKLFLDEDGILDDFAGAFDTFTDPSVEYPEMIYDGPFSDALQNREVKALKGMAEIDADKGAELIAKYFKDARNVSYQSETAGDVYTLNYTFDTDAGSAYAQLTKNGGLLINFNMSIDEAAASGKESEHCAAALHFAENAGYSDLRTVWCASANGITFVNLAPVSNGVVLYPDLIKVKVDEASGNVIGLDATHYAFNHAERKISAPAISVEDAAKRVTLPIVGEGMAALIPMDETREILTYEFECGTGEYYVYIDAMTGKEANILYVIDSQQGTVLM